MYKWILEGYFGNSRHGLQRIPLNKLPTTVGRSPHLVLSLPHPEISRHHAEFYEQDGQLMLRDLGSTNGTFVNREPIKGSVALKHGDVIHFAGYEVRVINEGEIEEPSRGDETMIVRSVSLSDEIPEGLGELQALLNARAVKNVFQPIVRLDGSLLGYEVLGRGAWPALPESPVALFRIAESMPGKDIELSVLMRENGLSQLAQKGIEAPIFINTHPSELKVPDQFIYEMARLREHYPKLSLVVEIHENAVTDIQSMKRLAYELAELDIELAYDDFGAGQARLLEMVEVPVRYVKFDIALIRGLPYAPVTKQKMVSALVAMTNAMEIETIAEGVETVDELVICKKMRFDYAQGYYFSRPRPVDHL